MRNKHARNTILALFLSITLVLAIQHLVYARWIRGGDNSIHYSIEQVCTNGIAFRLAGGASAPDPIGIRAQPVGEYWELYWENNFGVYNIWDKTFSLQDEEVFIPGIGTLPKSGFFASDWSGYALQPGTRVYLDGTTNGGFIGAYVTVEDCTLPDPLPETLADLGNLPERFLFPPVLPPDTTPTPFPIPASCDGVSATLSIPQDLIIADINVAMHINHSDPNELKATLTSPQGTTVTLFDQVDGPGSPGYYNDNNFGTSCVYTRSNYAIPEVITYFDEKPDFILDAESAFQFTSAHAVPPYYTTAFRPTGPGTLSDFYGENAAGQWTLNICDVVSTASGSLVCWSLEMKSYAVYLPIVIK